MGIIQCSLNKEQADALFSANAVMMCGRNVIFDYKIAELFGADACAWAEGCMRHDGYLEWGMDCNSWGDCGCNYFYKSGFEKIVSYHNYYFCLGEYRASEGGRLWDNLWQARRERMEAADREEERKRAERKAKREAARKAKQQAQEAKDDHSK